MDQEMRDAVTLPTLDEVRAASNRLAPYIVRTPLLRLNLHGARNSIYLKLENLQPIGSFKIRPMGNVMLSADKNALRNGAYTASSGNAGLGLAWIAHQLGIAATVYAPDNGPAAKLEPARELGARVCLISADQWWTMIEESRHPADSGYYADAVRSRAAMAGNGTIGLEIVEQLPEVDTVIIPFGGGGIACGIASVIDALKPDTRIVVAESEAATPLSAAFREGRPVRVTVQPSFISGAGAPAVLNEMWPSIRQLVDSTVVVSVSDVAEAIRLMFLHNRVVAEGAGAIAVAAALGGGAGDGTTVCIVTGGNIDQSIFCNILNRQPL
jgi:threonine dehydratase